MIIFKSYNYPKKFDSNNLISKKESYLNVKKKNDLTLNIFVCKFKENYKWQIEIPQIGLEANIAEGTASQTLDYYVGHFEETGTILGNICLAAHNRGYLNNYFEHIKDLKKGDIAYYTYYGIQKIYKIDQLLIIDDKNWDVLESSTKSELTLITCMEDKPHLRRCLKAVEK